MDGKEIVVGLNGSGGAALALRWAVEEGRLRSASLRIVHAWQLRTQEFAAGAELATMSETAAFEQATGWITAALGPSGAPGDLDIVEGPAGPVLVARSHQAALLVVGTQGHSGFRRVLAGSISHYCLSHAACPVVAVPGPASGHRHLPGARTFASAAAPGPLPGLMVAREQARIGEEVCTRGFPLMPAPEVRADGENVFSDFAPRYL